MARVLGLCILQEYSNLTDQDALDALGFDLRWRYALDVTEEEDYFSRRSLVEFRRRLVAKDPEMKLVRGIFDQLRDAAIKALGLSTRAQRLDSTHVISNIRVRGRVVLFANTLRVFLKSLNESQFPGPRRTSRTGTPLSRRAGLDYRQRSKGQNSNNWLSISMNF